MRNLISKGRNTLSASNISSLLPDTFAATVTLTNGVPIESVSKMPGHIKLQTTQIYARILDKKVSGDMQVLRNKFKAEKNVVEMKTGS